MRNLVIFVLEYYEKFSYVFFAKKENEKCLASSGSIFHSFRAESELPRDRERVVTNANARQFSPYASFSYIRDAH